MRPTTTIEACRRGHRLLLNDLALLTDDDFRVPSLLPGYTRGHVVTHLANKAASHVRLLDGAARDEVRRAHPDGYDPDRAAGLGAGRSAAALRAELAERLGALEAAWDGLDDAAWAREGDMTAGRRTMAQIVGHHLRNVEVHHVDLDVGYGPSDWPPVLVEAELGKRLRSLPGRADHADLLAWLLGRAPAPALDGDW